MLNRLSSLLCLSALGFGFVVLPANASETRVQDFSFQCDGTERTVVFNATGLGTSTNRFIQGTEVSVTASSLQSLLVQVAGNPNKTLLTMGAGDVSGRNQFTGFFQVTTDASGSVAFEIVATCQSKSPLNGIAVIYFFS